MKFKIYKLSQNNTIWYQIKKRQYLFWDWEYYIDRYGSKEPMQFYTEIGAKSHIDRTYGGKKNNPKIKVEQVVKYEC